MKIKLTRNTIAGGKPGKAGETVNVSDKSGRYLCEIGKAVPVRETRRETADKNPEENTSKNPKDGK